MTRRLLPPIVLVLGACLCACSGGEKNAPVSPGGGSPAQNATTAPLLPTTNNSLPLMGTAAYGELLSQLRGTPTVVNIWASWCGPCIQEAPMLRRAADENPNVQFLGIDILDTRGGARSFIEENGLRYPSVFDPSGAIRDELGFLGQPATVFYSSDGTMVRSIDGVLSQKVLSQGLSQITG